MMAVQAGAPVLGDIRRRVRGRLLEQIPGNSLFDDLTLNDWINEAARDVARRAETIQSFNTTISVTANVNKYAMPVDVIRVHRMEFVPTGSTQTYQIQLTTYEEMDQLWGTNQTTPMSYPQFAVMWGLPGGQLSDTRLQVQVYPVPSQGGTLNIFYYRQPYTATSDEDNVEIPVGWDDTVIDYCTYMAYLSDKDPRWQVAKQLYEDKVGELIDVTRQYHDSNRMIFSASGMPVPGPLYDSDYF